MYLTFFDEVGINGLYSLDNIGDYVICIWQITYHVRKVHHFRHFIKAFVFLSGVRCRRGSGLGGRWIWSPFSLQNAGVLFTGRPFAFTLVAWRLLPSYQGKKRRSISSQNTYSSVVFLLKLFGQNCDIACGVPKYFCVFIQIVFTCSVKP